MILFKKLVVLCLVWDSKLFYACSIMQSPLIIWISVWAFKLEYNFSLRLTLVHQILISVTQILTSLNKLGRFLESKLFQKLTQFKRFSYFSDFNRNSFLERSNGFLMKKVAKSAWKIWKLRMSKIDQKPKLYSNLNALPWIQILNGLYVQCLKCRGFAFNHEELQWSHQWTDEMINLAMNFKLCHIIFSQILHNIQGCWC